MHVPHHANTTRCCSVRQKKQYNSYEHSQSRDTAFPLKSFALRTHKVRFYFRKRAMRLARCALRYPCHTQRPQTRLCNVAVVLLALCADPSGHSPLPSGETLRLACFCFVTCCHRIYSRENVSTRARIVCCCLLCTAACRLEQVKTDGTEAEPYLLMGKPRSFIFDLGEGYPTYTLYYDCHGHGVSMCYPSLYAARYLRSEASRK